MKWRKSGRVSQWNCTVLGQWAPFPCWNKAHERSVTLQEKKGMMAHLRHMLCSSCLFILFLETRGFFSMKKTWSFYSVRGQSCTHYLLPTFPNTLSYTINSYFFSKKKSVAKRDKLFLLQESYWCTELLASSTCLDCCSSRSACQCPLGTCGWALLSWLSLVVLVGSLYLVGMWSISSSLRNTQCVKGLSCQNYGSWHSD